MMKLPCTAEVLEDFEEETWGNGPLTLGIWCTECGSQFELNKEAVAMAAISGASFIDFLKFVQNSSCRSCLTQNEIDE